LEAARIGLEHWVELFGVLLGARGKDPAGFMRGGLESLRLLGCGDMGLGTPFVRGELAF
jgi:hypothetical protein